MSRIGLIIPSSNTVMEVDFYRNLPNHITLHTDRIYIVNTSIDQQKKMIDNYLPEALKNINTINPDVIVFGCTSGGIKNSQGDEFMVENLIKSVIPKPVITVMSAVKKTLKENGFKKISLMTPYTDDLTYKVKKSLENEGFIINKSWGAGIVSNLETGIIKPEEIIDLALREFSKKKIGDCLFISCTNLRAMEIIDEISQHLNVPVVTSNKAALDMTISFCNSIIYNSN
jgi:maleate isomerase